MGQRANGILYGCEAPDFPDDKDGEAASYLVMRWEKANKIAWSTNGPKVRVENEGGKKLLGVWVAVGGSGEDDAPYFLDAAMPLGAIADVFAGSIKRAEKLWERFSAWCSKKEKIALPPADLWLTPCETA